RAADDAEPPVDHEQVVVRRCDVDVVRLELLAVRGPRRGKAPRAPENLREVAPLARRRVEDDEHRRAGAAGRTETRRFRAPSPPAEAPSATAEPLRPGTPVSCPGRPGGNGSAGTLEKGVA